MSTECVEIRGEVRVEVALLVGGRKGTEKKEKGDRQDCKAVSNIRDYTHGRRE